MAVVELPATEQLHGGGDLEGAEGSTACAALQLGSSLPQNLKTVSFSPVGVLYVLKNLHFYSHKLLLFEVDMICKQAVTKTNGSPLLLIKQLKISI